MCQRIMDTTGGRILFLYCSVRLLNIYTPEDFSFLAGEQLPDQVNILMTFSYASASFVKL